MTLLQEFLSDYGLVWVGNSTLSESDSEELSTSRASDAVWTQSESLPREERIDFNVLVAKINELNIISGEGVFKIERTADGARLKVNDHAYFNAVIDEYTSRIAVSNFNLMLFCDVLLSSGPMCKIEQWFICIMLSQEEMHESFHSLNQDFYLAYQNVTINVFSSLSCLRTGT
jgi:hypothetical protein